MNTLYSVITINFSPRILTKIHHSSNIMVRYCLSLESSNPMQGCSKWVSGRCCTSREFTTTSWKFCSSHICRQIQASYQFISYLEPHWNSRFLHQIIKLWILHIKTTMQAPYFPDWRGVYRSEHLPGILGASRNTPVSLIVKRVWLFAQWQKGAGCSFSCCNRYSVKQVFY